MNSTKSESQYRAIVKFIMIVTFFAALITFAASVAFPRGDKGPREFIGFVRGENVQVSRSRIAEYKIVDSGRIEVINLPFVAVENYVEPSGSKVDLLTLIFSDSPLPTLVAVGGTDGPYTQANARKVLEMYSTTLKVPRDQDRVSKHYGDGSVFSVAVLSLGDGTYAIVRVMTWEGATE